MASTPRTTGLRRSQQLIWLAAGVLLVVGGRWGINHTPVADWIVAPLIVPDAPRDVPLMVVLGAGVIGDCVPNQNGVRRVLLARRLWNAKPTTTMLFTGGTGGACPVAEAMARLAEGLGVPRHRIRVEPTSQNTHENALMSAALLKAWGVSEALVVTDRLHMRRASGAFNRQGIRVHGASVPIFEGHEDNVSMLAAGLREYVALAYYRLRGWIGPGAIIAADTHETAMTQSSPSRSPGPIVLLGASYAADWPLTTIGDVPVINKGVAGNQSFEMLARFDSDVMAASPRAVILWGFINDVARSGPDMDATVARIKHSYTLMIGRARAHGIVPVLATEVTMRPTSQGIMDWVLGLIGWLRGKTAYQDQVNRIVLAVNQWLIETGAREGLTVLRLQPVIGEPGGRRHPAFARPDGSHITPAGYTLLSNYAIPVLEESLGVR